MGKNSFSLLETLICVVILAVLSVGISKIISNNTDTLANNSKLDEAYFAISNDINTTTQTTQLNTSQGTLEVKKTIYDKDGIYFYRYRP